jgi:hypothetical protein
MTTQVTWGVIYTPTATATQIASKTAAINTTEKYVGLMVWDTTNKRQLRASGSTDVAAWDVIDGSASVIPS